MPVYQKTGVVQVKNVNLNDYKFSLTTVSNTDYLEIKICAAGDFYIDWGDGNIEEINKTNISGATKLSDYSNIPSEWK